MSMKFVKQMGIVQDAASMKMKEMVQFKAHAQRGIKCAMVMELAQAAT